MDLKQLAEECGLGWLLDPGDEFFNGPALTTLAEKIAAAEREACARLCEESASEEAEGKSLAEDIRARSNAELCGVRSTSERAPG